MSALTFKSAVTGTCTGSAPNYTLTLNFSSNGGDYLTLLIAITYSGGNFNLSSPPGFQGTVTYLGNPLTYSQTYKISSGDTSVTITCDNPFVAVLGVYSYSGTLNYTTGVTTGAAPTAVTTYNFKPFVNFESYTATFTSLTSGTKWTINTICAGGSNDYLTGTGIIPIAVAPQAAATTISSVTSSNGSATSRAQLSPTSSFAGVYLFDTNYSPAALNKVTGGTMVTWIM
jgi:hypothetical protein